MLVLVFGAGLPLALVCLVAGVGLVMFTDARWRHAIGIASLFGLLVLTFVGAAVAPD